MAACRVYCVSRTVFRLSLAVGVRCVPCSVRLLTIHNKYTRHAATAPTQHNDVNHSVFLNFNFSKEQCMLPEDDRVIETCRSVLSVLM